MTTTAVVVRSQSLPIDICNDEVVPFLTLREVAIFRRVHRAAPEFEVEAGRRLLGKRQIAAMEGACRLAYQFEKVATLKKFDKRLVDAVGGEKALMALPKRRFDLVLGDERDFGWQNADEEVMVRGSDNSGDHFLLAKVEENGERRIFAFLPAGNQLHIWKNNGRFEQITKSDCGVRDDSFGMFRRIVRGDHPCSVISFSEKGRNRHIEFKNGLIRSEIVTALIFTKHSGFNSENEATTNPAALIAGYLDFTQEEREKFWKLAYPMYSSTPKELIGAIGGVCHAAHTPDIESFGIPWEWRNQQKTIVRLSRVSWTFKQEFADYSNQSDIGIGIKIRCKTTGKTAECIVGGSPYFRPVPVVIPFPDSPTIQGVTELQACETIEQLAAKLRTIVLGLDPQTELNEPHAPAATTAAAAQ
jgi:hypothetical protein